MLTTLLVPPQPDDMKKIMQVTNGITDLYEAPITISLIERPDKTVAFIAVTMPKHVSHNVRYRLMQNGLKVQYT